MAEFNLTPSPPLAAKRIDYDGFAACSIDDRCLASIAAHRQRSDALTDAVSARYSVTLPDAGLRVDGEDITFIWAGQEQWFASSARSHGVDLDSALREAVGDYASITDQSDAWCQMALRGDGAYAVLERLCALDLHPDEFPVASAARTVMEHLSVQISLVSDTPEFELLTPSSSALAFWAALEHAAASACG